MKILIVSSEFPPCPGGIGNHAVGLFICLKNLGYDAKVISNSRDSILEKKWIFENNLERQVNLVPRLKPFFFTYFKRYIEVLKNIRILNKKNENCTVIFSGKFSLWLLALLPINNKYKIIAVLHGSEIHQNIIGRCLFKRAFKRANFLVSVSTYTQNKLLKSFNNFEYKSIVINNGFIPPKRFIISKYNKIHNLNTCKLITVGNLSRRKGQINVIRAMPIICKYFPSLKYDILGIPTELEVVNSEIKHLGLDKYVQIHGVVSEEIKSEYLSEALIFMMLSEELKNGDFEGFGIAILEANYLGLPAIGSKNSGIADAIVNGYSGFLVDPHNFSEIAEAVNTIMSDYKTFSNQAREHASKFLWENKVQQYLSLLN